MDLETRLPGTIRGEARDGHDERQLRHAGKVDRGIEAGRYLQAPPMLFTRDGHNVFLGDMYRGRSAFLICSGPSLGTHDLTQLRQRGVLTMSVNNAATVVPTHLWTCVDDPGNFADVIWQDPSITKFVPLSHMEKHFQVRQKDDALVPSAECVGDMPAVFGYRRNENFVASQWLYEDTFNWGNKGDRVDQYGNKGSRSVMYVALRLLFFLGCRRVYLLGCDFKMQLGVQNYAFPQERSAGSVRGNNSSYRILNVRLGHLLPYFSQEGFEVVNCTPSSGLTVFPYLPFEEALERATSKIPSRIVTEGMYDRKQAQVAEEQAIKTRSVVSKAPSEEQAAALDNGKPRSHLPTSPVQRRPRPAAIPDGAVTVITVLDESLHSIWRTASRSWLRTKPAISTAPWIVAFDPLWRCAKERLDPQLSDRHEPIPWDPWALRFSSQRERLASGWIGVAARHVKTPWILTLAGSVIATEENPDLVPADCFVQDHLQRLPVMIGDVPPLSIAHKELPLLNRWAESVPGLASHPVPSAIAPGWSDGAIRDRSSRVCLIRTEWLREQWQLLQRSPPETFAQHTLAYCAARRRDYVIAANSEACGWRTTRRSERFWMQPAAVPSPGGRGVNHG